MSDWKPLKRTGALLCAVTLIGVYSTSAQAVPRASNSAEDVSALIADVAPDQGLITNEHESAWDPSDDGRVRLNPEPQSLSTARPSAAASTKDSSTSPIEISLPTGSSTAQAETASDGTLVYSGEDGVDIAVQLVGSDSVRIHSVSHDDVGSQEFAYTFSEGTRLVETDSGKIDVLQQSGPALVKVGEIDAPWAVDAAGSPVATNYRIEGRSLIQEVHPTEDVTYPIVADPKVTSTWWNRTVYFNKQETLMIAAGAGGCASVAGLIPEPTVSKVIAAACGLLSAYASGITASGSCLKAVHYLHQPTPVPQPYGGSEAGGYCR